MALIEIPGTDYVYDDTRLVELQSIANRVAEMRKGGSLSPQVLHHILKYFKIKNIYHSNAIEGNVLEVGETRQVVELGLTITGKPLKDQAEARNLSNALNFFEELAAQNTKPISEFEVRQLHQLVLQGLSDEAGAYRSVQVTITDSDYAPPGPEVVTGKMAEFGAWLHQNSTPDKNAFAGIEGLLAAAAAHTWFVTVHPFIDGNGRVARLLMNIMLMRHGYPIAVISKEDRLRYYDALEISQASDLTPFIALLIECVSESLEEYEIAADEQRQMKEWATSHAERFDQPEREKIRNEYEVWKNAMELLKSYFQKPVGQFNQVTQFGRIYFKDFGTLEFEKYCSLRQGYSAKKTWFLRVDFRRGERVARYLLFFGHASQIMGSRCDVTLHVAREEPTNSFNYERTETLTVENVPGLVEIGYEISKGRYIVRMRKSQNSRISRVEEFTREFFTEILKSHFTN